jgi:hypothetical protein
MADALTQRALDLLQQAIEAAQEAVAQATSAQQALERAGAFFQGAVETKGKAAEMRATTAALVWKHHTWDITQPEIGRHLGVNRQRAHQLIAEGQATRKGQS